VVVVAQLEATCLVYVNVGGRACQSAGIGTELGPGDRETRKPHRDIASPLRLTNLTHGLYSLDARRNNHLQWPHCDVLSETQCDHSQQYAGPPPASARTSPARLRLCCIGRRAGRGIILEHFSGVLSGLIYTTVKVLAATRCAYDGASSTVR
jgi:hypothetical protein